MTQYTVIISAADDQAETVVSVDTASGEPRVTEVAVRSRAGAGVTLHQMPDIDLQMLVRALWPSGEPATTQPAKTQPAKSTPQRAAGGKKPPAAARRTAPASGQPVVRAGRVYRKMPDDLAEVYAERGTVVAVAKHYGVPRHTAQGWVSRLRASSAGSD